MPESDTLDLHCYSQTKILSRSSCLVAKNLGKFQRNYSWYYVVHEINTHRYPGSLYIQKQSLKTPKWHLDISVQTKKAKNISHDFEMEFCVLFCKVPISFPLDSSCVKKHHRIPNLSGQTEI